MTILPTIRAISGNSYDADDEISDISRQRNVKDRRTRHRDEHTVASEPGTLTRRPFPYNTNKNERKDRNLQKRYKVTTIELSRDRRARERQKQRELRRKRKHEHQTKRCSKLESQKDDTSTADDSENTTPSSSSESKETYIEEDGIGCNSEDEYISRRKRAVSSPTDVEWTKRDLSFSRYLRKLGFEIKKMNEDGACLFRAIADQVYGDQEMHLTVRSQCMDYIVKHRDFFALYVTEDFDKYVERKRRWHVHGNHLEIQAISEMYNRTIEVYCYHTEPIKIFSASSMNTYEPIRISYHRMCHYNSITNPKKPSILVGLGLPPNPWTRCDVDGREIQTAVRQSEELLIEQVNDYVRGQNQSDRLGSDKQSPGAPQPRAAPSIFNSFDARGRQSKLCLQDDQLQLLIERYFTNELSTCPAMKQL